MVSDFEYLEIKDLEETLGSLAVDETCQMSQHQDLQQGRMQTTHRYGVLLRPFEITHSHT